MTRTFILRLAVAAGGILCWGALAAPSPNAEQQLSSAIEQMRSGKSSEALKSLEHLTHQEPNFRLGQLIYGELLAALSGARGGTLLADNADPAVQELAEEARLRLASEKAVPPEGSLPNAILKLAPAYKHLIVVDLPRARLYLMKNTDGELTLLRNSYAAMGKKGYGKQTRGDHRTPVGIYHITAWKSDKELPELYGAGAFPISYPNPWDVFKNRNGTGIWLHGVPRTVYNRPPRSSEGCVTMANEDLLALKPYVDLGQTPVVLSDQLQWVPQNQLRAERESWLTRVEDWRTKWASKDTDAYLSAYSPEFTTEGMKYAAFAEHKRRVNAAKKYIKVALRDINLFPYPGATASEPLVLAEFTLDYQSDNYNTTVQKQQFWRQEKSGEWKIFREENR